MRLLVWWEGGPPPPLLDYGCAVVMIGVLIDLEKCLLLSSFSLGDIMQLGTYELAMV